MNETIIFPLVLILALSLIWLINQLPPGDRERRQKAKEEFQEGWNSFADYGTDQRYWFMCGQRESRYSITKNIDDAFDRVWRKHELQRQS